ncbi:MAG: tRNA uracil 4-sulfurtransferase ThiI [Bacillota bacterium]
MKTLIVKYGELALKKGNRGHYESVLIRNIKKVLKGLDFKIIQKRGRIYIEFSRYTFDEIISKVKKVFGIVGLAPCLKCKNNINEMNKAAKELVENALEDNNYKSFKVETRRANKGFKYKSPEISTKVGGFINQTFDELKVDVHNPDLVIDIEVRKKSFVYVNETKCFGGLPYSTSGKGLLLLSGGIDSPVAGWMMAKRGVTLEAIHFHSYPFTSKKATNKVLGLARELSKYTQKIKVHSVNILDIYKEIKEKCPDKHFTIIGRRFMTKISEKIAKYHDIDSLITGENIGQVASQTMKGLNITNSSVNIPIFRPLIGFDKNDIISKAKMIGTYETSILPYEDCCTVFLPQKVDTSPKLEDIEKLEESLKVDSLIKNAIDKKETFIITPSTELTY